MSHKTNTTIRLAIVGATGRMGQAILANALAYEHLQIVAGIVSSSSPYCGAALENTTIVATSRLADIITDCDIVIDFSTPESSIAAAATAMKAQKAFITGTTGLSDRQQHRLQEYAQNIPILYASNFSVGVNILEHLVTLASQSCGNDFDIEITEAHHRHKVDAPSGTALFLAQAAARGREMKLNDIAQWTRHGHVGPRNADEIGFQVIRGGDIVGEHTVYFCGQGERLELSHRATDRGIFARGALRAATWIMHKPAGWYSMQDVLFK